MNADPLGNTHSRGVPVNKARISLLAALPVAMFIVMAYISRAPIADVLLAFGGAAAAIFVVILCRLLGRLDSRWSHRLATKNSP